MTPEEILSDNFNRLFSDWNEHRDVFSREDMYRQFAKFLSDRIFELENEINPHFELTNDFVMEEIQ